MTTIDELPGEFWRTPVPDLVLDDLFDALFDECERLSGGVLFLLCDDRDRLRTPVIIGEVPKDQTAGERRHCLRTVTGPLGDGGSVLIGLGRSGRLAPTAADRAWLADAIDVCGHRIRLLGVHRCSPSGSRRVT